MLSKLRFVFAFLCLCTQSVSAQVRGTVVCEHPDPDSTLVTVHFGRSFEGSYRTGQPYDVVTVAPDGRGETLAGAGISIRVSFKTFTGSAIVGMPPQEILLWNPGLHLCPGGSIADAHTDISGTTTFSGTLAAGGCVDELQLYAAGILMARIPVKLNSPDLNADGFVDGSDIAAFARLVGARAGDARYSICSDFNESGSIDSSDLAFLGAFIGSTCP